VHFPVQLHLHFRISVIGLFFLPASVIIITVVMNVAVYVLFVCKCLRRALSVLFSQWYFRLC